MGLPSIEFWSEEILSEGRGCSLCPPTTHCSDSKIWVGLLLQQRLCHADDNLESIAVSLHCCPSPPMHSVLFLTGGGGGERAAHTPY